MHKFATIVRTHHQKGYLRRERRQTSLLLQTMRHTAGLIHSSQAMPAFTSAMISRLQGGSGEVDEHETLNGNNNYDR